MKIKIKTPLRIFYSCMAWHVSARLFVWAESADGAGRAQRNVEMVVVVRRWWRCQGCTWQRCGGSEEVVRWGLGLGQPAGRVGRKRGRG